MGPAERVLFESITDLGIAGTPDKAAWAVAELAQALRESGLLNEASSIVITEQNMDEFMDGRLSALRIAAGKWQPADAFRVAAAYEHISRALMPPVTA